MLPATPATLAAARKAYDATKGEPAKPVTLGEGGFATSKFALFLLDGKLLKVSGPAATVGKYAVLGQDVVQQAAGLPEAQPLITRPDCERGSSRADKVLRVPPLRSGGSRNQVGDLVCGWITTTGLLYTTVRRVADAEKVIAPVRKAPTSESVPLGDEGYVDTASGRGIIRVGTDKMVDLVPLPAGTADKDDMVAFALSMASVYTR